MVLAPSFRKVTDARKEGELYWGRRWYTKWKYGYISEDSDKISSFEVIDLLIKNISLSGYFPNLKTIVVTGHSAGGQFTQRYAVGTEIRSKITQDIQFVPSNPSSYMYLDESRYHFKTGNFELAATPTNCTDYNHYIYGPKNRAAYLKKFTVEELRNNFKKNNVIYLMSEEDKGIDSLDRSCGAMSQGKNRFERAKNFFYYVKKKITYDGHHFLSIPEVGHDHIKVYESQEAATIIFGLKGEENKHFLYGKIGNINDVQTDSDSQFVMFGGGRNEIEGMKSFLTAAHGGDLLIISGKKNLNHRYTHEFWNMSEQEKIPLDSVEVISFLGRDAGEDKFVLDKIRKAEAIFFTGGDQSKYIIRIKNTSAHREILNKVRSGISIAGTSAGLAIMGEYIFSAKKGGLSSRYVLKNPNSEYIALVHDFFFSPLLKNLITDTHFTERKREGRLLGFMFNTQVKFQEEILYGVGIDEQTSLELTIDFKMKSFGKGYVTFYQAPEILPSRSLGPFNFGPVRKQILLKNKSYPHFNSLTFKNHINILDGQVFP